MNECSPWSPEAYIRAFTFAAAAHNGQIIPGTDLPYLMHIGFVAMEVIAALERDPGLTGDLAVQCALLHDTLEDTETTCVQLIDEFGIDVAAGVLALTKDPAKGDSRMADSLARTREQPREIWVVKLADRITNLQPPPAYWTTERIRHYREESKEIHRALSSASRYLADRLSRKIAAYAQEVQ
jgi:(p)ppGpp synthase/HD superfamily hydrolase